MAQSTSAKFSGYSAREFLSSNPQREFPPNTKHLSFEKVNSKLSNDLICFFDLKANLHLVLSKYNLRII